MISRLWARVLFDSGALEVETLEESLHVSSPLGTRVSVD